MQLYVVVTSYGPIHVAAYQMSDRDIDTLEAAAGILWKNGWSIEGRRMEYKPGTDPFGDVARWKALLN